MSCDVGKAREELGMSYDVVEATESLENELCFQSLHLRHSSFPKPSLALPTSQLILQPFRCFTYVTAHSPTLLSLLLRHSIFVTSHGEPPMPFRRFTYVTAHSPTRPLLHLCHSSFSIPSFASPTSQAFHLIHLASRPCRDIGLQSSPYTADMRR